jgi:hypothetical protein
VTDINMNKKYFKGRYQAFYSLSLLALLVGTCLATDLLARNKRLEMWLTAQQYKVAKQTNRLFSYAGNFIDFEERALLEEIPQADYSRGGVFFFGTSNMKWAFQTWDLPAGQRNWIGNYGIGASNHTIQLHLIRYLIEQRGFLTAGDRDLVIFGVSAHLGHVDSPGTTFFDSLLRRHGLFMTTPDGEIVLMPMSAIERWLRVEKARAAGFFWHVGVVIKGWVELIGGSTHRPSRDLSRYRDYMGPQWKQDIDSEVEQFKRAILLVRSYRAKVLVILLPQGSWMEGLPFKSYYEAKIGAMCDATSTPLIDLSRSIPDNEFVDSNHLTVEGQEEFRKLIMEEINEQLQTIEAANGLAPK